MCNKWVSQYAPPLEMGRYMVHTIDGAVTAGVFYPEPKPRGIWRVAGEYPEVTHWMPVPEPPKKLTDVEELERVIKKYGTQKVKDCYCDKHTVNITIHSGMVHQRGLDAAILAAVKRGMRGY